MVHLSSENIQKASIQLYRDAMYTHLLRSGFSAQEAELIVSRAYQSFF
jgi:hypothetical protein